MELVKPYGEINSKQSEKSLRRQLGALARRSFNTLLNREKMSRGKELFLPAQYNSSKNKIVQPLKKGILHEKKGQAITPREHLPTHPDETLIISYVSRGFSHKSRKHRVVKPWINEDTLEVSDDKYQGYLVKEKDEVFTVLDSYLIDADEVTDIDDNIVIGRDGSSELKLERLMLLKDMGSDEEYGDHRSNASGEMRHSEWDWAKRVYGIDNEISRTISRKLPSLNGQ